MRNILITGGAGFIGSNLTIKLVSHGYNVTILDNLSKQIHGENQNSTLYKSTNGISRFILGDVCNKLDWEKAIKGQDVIIHFAAETGIGQSMYEISRYNKVNIIGASYLLNILANKEHSVKKIIIGSSRAIYGEGKYYCNNDGVIYPNRRKERDMARGIYNPFCNICNNELEPQATDENSIINPSSIYGITKQHQEQMFLLIGKALNIPAVSLRYQNVYGPGQSLLNPYTGILSIFSTRILNGNNIDIYEDGKESRDFVYINDVVKATILALEKQEANHQIFNVGSGIATTVLEVAEKLKELYKSDIKIIVNEKYRLGDIRHNYADLTKIKNKLGFVPDVDFDTGIKNFVNWVKKQKIQSDKYEITVGELERKGLLR